MHPVKHLSYSSVSLLQTCGHAFMKRYILKARGDTTSYHLVLGSAFHDVVEQTIGAIATGSSKKPALERMPDLFVERLGIQIGTQKIDWIDKSLEEILVLGVGMFKSATVWNFCHNYKPMMSNAGKPAIEMKFSMTIPGVPVPVIGFIDLIDENGIPCDLKTAGKRWGIWKANKELQPIFYLEALRQMGAKRNPHHKFEYVIFVKKVPAIVERLVVTKTEQDYSNMIKLIQSAWSETIEKGAYPKSGIGSWKCNPAFCDHYESCLGGKDEKVES